MNKGYVNGYTLGYLDKEAAMAAMPPAAPAVPPPAPAPPAQMAPPDQAAPQGIPGVPPAIPGMQTVPPAAQPEPSPQEMAQQQADQLTMETEELAANNNIASAELGKQKEEAKAAELAQKKQELEQAAQPSPIAAAPLAQKLAQDADTVNDRNDLVKDPKLKMGSKGYVNAKQVKPPAEPKINQAAAKKSVAANKPVPEPKLLARKEIDAQIKRANGGLKDFLTNK